MKIRRTTILPYIIIALSMCVPVGLVAGIQAFKEKAPIEEVVVVPETFEKLTKDKDASSWQTFTAEQGRFTIQHPANVTIDERQTSPGRITVFIFEEDKTASLPGKVTALYIAETNKKDVDGFTAFRKGDCGRECKVSYKNVSWININNAYGVKNPLPGDVHNYYLTDKNKTKSVINAYVGGYLETNDKEVQKKIKMFENMIKTLSLQ